jgi:type II secretory pathway pseudopilin PulG
MAQHFRFGSAGTRQCAGFAYLAMLGALALIAAAVLVVGPTWQMQAQQEKEQQLLRVGASYALAIASYRRMKTGSVTMGPPTLAALLLDDRFPRPVRHLRQTYADPMNPTAPWGLVRDARGHILGVHSTSLVEPLRRTPVVVDGIALGAARTYADWKFVAKDIE